MNAPLRLILGFGDWPELDRAAWETALVLGEVLDPDGLAARWKPKTRKQVAKDYGMWLSYLTRASHHPCGTAPEDRLSRHYLRGYVSELGERLASESVCSRLVNLSEAYRVMYPHIDRGDLRRLISRHRSRAAPSRKKHARIRSSQELLAGALSYMERTVAGYAPSETIRAAWIRNSLIIALLAAHPIRLANLTQIELDVHLTRKDGIYWLRFAPSETKSGNVIVFPLIAELQMPLQVYIDRYRPILLGDRESDSLWISVRKKPMTEQAIYCQVVQATTEIFGAPVNPHLFRDCAMTTLATDAPELARIGARLLGHNSLNTGERHYNHGLMTSAASSYHDSLKKLRGTRPPD